MTVSFIQANEETKFSDDEAKEVSVRKWVVSNRMEVRAVSTEQDDVHWKENTEFGLYTSKVAWKISRRSEETPNVVHKKNPITAQSVERHAQEGKSLTEGLEHYDLLSYIRQTDTGISIGRIPHGVVNEAKTVARRVFLRRRGKWAMDSLKACSNWGETFEDRKNSMIVSDWSW